MFACSDLWPSIVNIACFWSIILLPNFYSILQAERVDEERMSASECQEAGFNSERLKCSACRMLDKFNLEEILTDCMRCCEEEPKVERGERFHIAELQVCKCNLHRFPQIAAFVQGDMKYQWGDRLVVKQVSGVLPTILLKSADGQTERTLNIEKWDTDTITDFLNNILQDEKDEL